MEGGMEICLRCDQRPVSKVGGCYCELCEIEMDQLVDERREYAGVVGPSWIARGLLTFLTFRGC